MTSQENYIAVSSIWPAEQLNEAVQVLAQESGLTIIKENLPELPVSKDYITNDIIDQWMEFASTHLEISIMQVESTYNELEQMLRMAAPSIVRLKTSEQSGFLAILKGSKQKLTIINTDWQRTTILISQVCHALTGLLAQKVEPSVQKIVEEARIAEDRQNSARTAIIREQLSEALIKGVWLLSVSPGADLKKQILHSSISFQFISILASHCIGHLLMIMSWWVIARQATEGHFERYAMVAWAFLLICLIPFRVLDKWSQNIFAMSIGGMFKQRLLSGIIQLVPEEIRHKGSGQFLGTIMEAESLGSLAMDSGMLGIVAMIELFFAFWILLLGAGGLIHAMCLLVWIMFSALVCFTYYHYAKQWVSEYRDMTNDMVERMVGYRTRLIQENPLHWHDEEEQIISNYMGMSKKMDNWGIIIQGVNGHAWLIFSMPVILYAFLTQSCGMGVMAIGVGGIILASQAFTQFSVSVIRIIQVLAAWDYINPLFQAAERFNKDKLLKPFKLPFTIDEASAAGKYPLIKASNLSFRYHKDLPIVLKPFTQQIEKHDRILLEGPSGGGKSTLSAVLSALRQPDDGKLLLWGMDLKAVGKNEWRKRVVIAPQFHENHVLTETFGFNLLMGRRWPPLNKEVKEALTICKELGLGPLLEKMPAGFNQMIGEGGWQLSHGERSRLFIARALLQKSDLIILDESFAALDPENMYRCLTFVFEHAQALIVVAHP
jgi:ATP-binding cassette subfamily B protein